jgi:hypothetical protein
MTSLAPAPARVGQTTAIEQSRAAAEVQARVLVALRFPRDTQKAERDMTAACARPALAEIAFYEYPRGRERIKGKSVYLAAELARCWGNFDYGIWELARDDEHGQSEMLAFAWDLETNTRVASGFIVPHKRDTKDGAVSLDAMRDIYENNANQGARRVREAIFRLLPRWYVDTAADLCRRTLEHGDGTPKTDRITTMLAGFQSFGVAEADIVRRLGRPARNWTDADLADLGVTYRSMQRGEIGREEAFPGARITTEEIAGAAKLAQQSPEPPPPPAPPGPPVATPAAPKPPEPPEPAAATGQPRTSEVTPLRASRTQNPADRERNKLYAILGGWDLNAARRRGDKLDLLSDLAGRRVDSSAYLTADEVHRAVEILGAIARGAKDDQPLAVAHHIEEGRKHRSTTPKESG